MKCKPILFSPGMVRAILDGRKTQTRRVVKWPPHVEADQIVQVVPAPYYGHGRADKFVTLNRFGGIAVKPFSELSVPGRYRPGDVLWVRERWCRRMVDGEWVYNAEGNSDPSCYYYEATNPDVLAMDGDGFLRFNKDGSEASPWSPSIHMPRAACRLWLKVEVVRVERLQDISEADAIAEGVPFDRADKVCVPAYGKLWDSINGAGSWAANPWVWVYTFSRAEKPEGWGA